MRFLVGAAFGVVVTAIALVAAVVPYRDCIRGLGYHFLERSARYGDRYGVNVLLQLGVDASGRGYDSYIACFDNSPFDETLFNASTDGDPEVLPSLPEFASPLIGASDGGHLYIVEQLLAHGANPNAVEGAAWTALSGAAKGGHVEIAQALLAAGARIHEDRNEGPIELATREGHVDVLRLLRDAQGHD